MGSRSVSDKEGNHWMDKSREWYPINAWDDIEYDAPHPVPCWERRRRATVLSIDPTNSNSDILDTTTNECIPNGHLVKKIGTIVNCVTVPFDGIFMPLEWHILTHQTNPDGVTGGTCVAKKLQGAFGAARKLVAKKAAKQGTAQLPVDMQPFCISIGNDWQNRVSSLHSVPRGLQCHPLNRPVE